MEYIKIETWYDNGRQSKITRWPQHFPDIKYISLLAKAPLKISIFSI